MRLSEYMTLPGKSAADIARESGVATSRLSCFLDGQHALSAKNLERIIRATREEVTFTDLVEEGRELRKRRARRLAAEART